MDFSGIGLVMVLVFNLMVGMFSFVAGAGKSEPPKQQIMATQEVSSTTVSTLEVK